MPVALAGVLFFALVLLLAGVGGRPGAAARENVAGYIFALSTVGLAFVLYLAWASFFLLKVFCILCAITYVAVIAIFIISGGATTFPMTTLPRRARARLPARSSRVPSRCSSRVLFVGGAAALISRFPARRRARAAERRPRRRIPPLTDARARRVRGLVGHAAEGRHAGADATGPRC